MFALHDRSGYAISRQNNLELKKKKTSSCIWVPISITGLFYIDMPVVRTDGKGGRSVGRCTVTWLPTFLRWVDYFIFLPMVLRWHASIKMYELVFKEQ